MLFNDTFRNRMKSYLVLVFLLIPLLGCDSSSTNAQFEAEVTGDVTDILSGEADYTIVRNNAGEPIRFGISMVDDDQNLGIDGLTETGRIEPGVYEVVPDALSLEPGQVAVVFNRLVDVELGIPVRIYEGDRGELIVSNSQNGVTTGRFDFEARGAFGTVGGERRVAITGTFAAQSR